MCHRGGRRQPGMGVRQGRYRVSSRQATASCTFALAAIQAVRVVGAVKEGMEVLVNRRPEGDWTRVLKKGGMYAMVGGAQGDVFRWLLGGG